jgi:glycosyltransferase involved in cell wall biosynthesis
MPTCYFLCPDYDVPSGGIRVIYRFVDILNSAGISAAVVHRSGKFRCTWFENETVVLGAKDVRFQKGDLLVIPEWYRQLIPLIAVGVPHIIFNQNAYEMFSEVPYERGKNAGLMSADTIGIVGISEDNLRYLELCFPDKRIDAIRLSIDTELFQPRAKTKVIAYMPRKRLKELNQILHVLEHRNSLDGWELLPIIGVPETEVARRLGGAAIFLTLNAREGIAVPGLEALASGCVVVGFHGGSGEEYMTPDVAVPIADGEVVSLVLALESEMQRWVEHDEAQLEMTRRAVELVKSKYTRERERSDVIRVFSEALERVAEVIPGSIGLKPKLVPSTSEQLKRRVRPILRSRK